MRLFIPLLSILIITVIACNKDKFQTKPTLSIKSMSGDIVPLNGNFEIRFECTDKEGDVQDTIFLFKKRLNRRPTATTARDTIKYQFPEFPSKQRTEIIVTYNYQDILQASSPLTIPGSNPPQKERDSFLLRVVVKDRAGHTSDTIESKMIQVIR